MTKEPLNPKLRTQVGSIFHGKADVQIPTTDSYSTEGKKGKNGCKSNQTRRYRKDSIL